MAAIVRPFDFSCRGFWAKYPIPSYSQRIKELLRLQLNGSFALLTEVVDSASDEEWKSRPHPGANLVGFIPWHGARTLDWAVNCVLRQAPELADSDEWADLKVPGALFGAGISREAADRAAEEVPKSRVRDYLSALGTETLVWLDGVPATELGQATDLRRSHSGKPEYMEPTVWAELEDLDGIPKWQFLARPCVAHIRVHYGGVTSQLEAMRAARGR